MQGGVLFFYFFFEKGQLHKQCLFGMQGGFSSRQGTFFATRAKNCNKRALIWARQKYWALHLNDCSSFTIKNRAILIAFSKIVDYSHIYQNIVISLIALKSQPSG